jgi:hypothetical protein
VPKLIQIAPVAVPGMGQATDVVVWALDNDGGLWKWDTGMKSDEWLQLVKPLKKRKKE